MGTKSKEENSKIEFTMQILKEEELKLKKSTVENLGGIRFDTGDNIMKPEYLPTGLEEFDKFIGGGLPRGRFTELYGDPKAGKTTLALQSVVKLQEMGQEGMWIDLENKWDPTYASILGVDTSKIIVVRVDKVEAIMNALIQIAKRGAIDYFVIDSVASGASVKKEEDLTRYNMAVFARQMSEWIPQIRPYLVTNNITAICINQVRENITKMGSFGKKSTGGNAWAHEVYLSIYMRKTKGGLPNLVKFKIMRERELMISEGDIIDILLTRFGFGSLDWVDEIAKNTEGINTTKDSIKIKNRKYPKGIMLVIGEDKVNQILTEPEPVITLKDKIVNIITSIAHNSEIIENTEEEPQEELPDDQD